MPFRFSLFPLLAFAAVLANSSSPTSSPGASGTTAQATARGSRSSGQGRPAMVLTKVGETDINNAGDLFRALTRHRAGEKVTVNYIRAGDSNSAEVMLG